MGDVLSYNTQDLYVILTAYEIRAAMGLQEFEYHTLKTSQVSNHTSLLDN